MFGDVTFAQAPFAALGGNSFAAAQDETAAVVASPDSQGVIRGGLQSESATGQDARAAAGILIAAQAETAAAASLQTVIATMVASTLEQAGATAAQAAIGTFLAAQAELAAATGAQAASGAFLATQAEAATVSEETDRGLLISVFIVEGATGEAAQVSQAVVSGSIAEAVSALSALGVVREANVYPTGVQLIISIGGALVWATIDDQQNPNWQNIANTQGSGWVVVDDGQTPNWTQLPS